MDHIASSGSPRARTRLHAQREVISGSRTPGPSRPRYATDVVEHVLAQARAAEASDVHLHPGADGLEVRWRIDGVLQPVAVLPSRLAANVVARLKVLAEFLTYRTDVPQEGRIRAAPGEIEMRFPTFPTLHGEKAAVRLFAGSGRFLRLADSSLTLSLVRLESLTYFLAGIISGGFAVRRLPPG